MPESLADIGHVMSMKFAPDAPETVLAHAAHRIDAYLSKNYDKSALVRSAPPGILYKSGAASILMMWRQTEVVPLENSP